VSIARSASAPASLDQFAHTLPGKAVIAISASVFVAACAHVSFPLPFTPVPLTLGNMAVILVGLFLSPATAFAAVILYLAEGAAGLPVFNPGGLGGVAQLVGPTGGFLFAYPLAAVAASAIVRAASRVTSRFTAATLAATLGTAMVLLCGFLWLAVGKHITPAAAFVLSVAPFLPGEIVKVLSAAGIYTSIQRWRKA
jgi:biotin transport system substrate-specific component